MDLVRVNDHGRGTIAPTHERPQFVRSVIESIIGIVMLEVVEERVGPLRRLSTPGVQFLGMRTSRNSRVFCWFVRKFREIC